MYYIFFGAPEAVVWHDLDMDNPDLAPDELADIACVFYAGETDFKARVLAELRRLELGERHLMRGASADTARRYRERADAIKGALAFVEKLAPKGRDVELAQRGRPRPGTGVANEA